MGALKDFLTFSFLKKDVKSVSVYEPEAFFSGSTPIFAVSYNGEKNLGEIGPIKKYHLDYEALRLRSWQAYIESEIAQTVIKKYNLWIIGAGLKIRTEPSEVILKSEGLTIDTEAFNEITEARFTLFANSVYADMSEMRTLNQLARRAHLNAINGGDVLVILRYVDKKVTVQLVDGSNVCSPLYQSNYYKTAQEAGNTIKDGIEFDKNGKPVAYYVKDDNIIYNVNRVLAESESTGLKMAYLVYGLEYRIDNCRGIPLISTVLETLKKLERYKEATVGSAEERQKIPFFIEHQLGGTGENPMQGILAKARNADAVLDDVATTEEGEKLATTVAATSNKTVYNMPNGAKMVSMDSKQELHFKDFYTGNIDVLCASVPIPPEVAMSKYDSNFSASRAALKDWEHTINTARKDFSAGFYAPIYNFWLHVQILQNKITAPGYLEAFKKKNWIVIEAYRTARWIGTQVPHIDPLKEVEAERLKLGSMGANAPLTTIEAATENLNSGESDSNIKQFSEELDMMTSLKLDIYPKTDLPAPPATQGAKPAVKK